MTLNNKTKVVFSHLIHRQSCRVSGRKSQKRARFRPTPCTRLPAWISCLSSLARWFSGFMKEPFDLLSQGRAWRMRTHPSITHKIYFIGSPRSIRKNEHRIPCLTPTIDQLGCLARLRHVLDCRCRRIRPRPEWCLQGELGDLSHRTTES